MRIFNDVVEIMQCASNLTINKKRLFSKNNTGLIGWNQFVKPLKERSIACTNEWKSLGCPMQGDIADGRRQARKDYHSAVRYIKQSQDYLTRCKVAHNLGKRNFRDFWGDIKKLKKNDKISVHVIDHAVGDDNICKLFESKYYDLYNFDDSNINDVRFLVDKELEKCNKGICKQLHKFTMNDMNKAVKSLKRSKYDNIYDINSNNIIFGNESLYFLLLDLFNAMLVHGCTEKIFNKSILTPILKDNRKSASSSDNYRAISLCSVLCKLFEYCVINSLDTFLKSSSYQFAYKQSHSTLLCTFMVGQVIQYYRDRKSNVFSLSLDASKAFDKVKYDKLFRVLIENKICPLFVRIILNMYLQNNCTIKWNGIFSENFDIKSGVKQGGVLSPLLFALYLDPLLKRLRDSNVGCYMDQTPVNSFSYADDIVILSPSITAMVKLIRICEIYSLEFGLDFNVAKCCLVPFSSHNNNLNVKLKLNNVEIPVSDSYKHLGNNIFNRNSMFRVDDIITDMKIRSNVLINEFSKLDIESKKVLFKSQCLGLYGRKLLDLEHRSIYTLCVA